MHKNREYKLYVRKFSPDTIPLDRLADYADALSKLLNVKAGVVFGGLENGSTIVVAKVDWDSSEEVDRNVREQSKNPANSSAIRNINDLLKRDKTDGRLLDYKGAEVISFPGINTPEAFKSPTFREQVSVYGQLVRIGGTDETVHAKLVDGSREYNVTMNRDMAREVAAYLFGEVLKFTGSGRFKREQSGEWKMVQFDTVNFQVSDDGDLLSSIKELRNMRLKGLTGKNAYDSLDSDNGEENYH